ncbi:MAG: DUF4145 domain-containing protein [Syntrophomonas sp.]
MDKYYPPKYMEEAFHCPYCQVYAHQHWHTRVQSCKHGYSFVDREDLRFSVCGKCGKYSLWYKEQLIIPDSSTAPMPHDDLPEDCKLDYMEARSIVGRSPRGVAALLRLCLQKLMVDLGEPGKDINKDIASLVKQGLPDEIQQALDIVRVIGNEAVHPGELDLKDDNETALQLFELINFIVEERITRRKKITTLFKKLPEAKLEGIQKRDN